MSDRSAGTRIRVPLELSVTRLLTKAGYQVESTPSRQSTRSLFDTGDRRLAAAGGELSLTVHDGWRWRRDTLDHPKLTPREWTAPPTTPHPQLLEWTRAYRRGRPVAERGVIVVRSRRHIIRSGQADPLLTLVEERLLERTTSGPVPRVHRVEIAQASSDADGAIAVVRGAAIDDVATLTLVSPGRRRAAAMTIPAPDRTGARDLFARSTTLSLIQWLYFDCELSAGSPEALRKLRVAMRRLRSDLQTFAPLLDRRWADQLREQLGGLAGRLGVVRDAEVLGERLGVLVAQLPDAERADARSLLDTAATQLATARAELLEELGRREYLEVLEQVVAGVTSTGWKDGDHDVRVQRLARRPWRRLRSYVEAIEQPVADAQLHRIRILAKRARYAADACVPAVGARAAECAVQLAALQTVLGEHHDAVVTREWLHHQAQAMAGVSFAAGEMAALELRSVEKAGRRWREQWAVVSRAENWRWLRS